MSVRPVKPRVRLFDNLTEKNVVIVEITIPASEKKDFGKVAQLIEQYEIPEGFTYNYKTKKWRKYKLSEGEITENPSFCEAIRHDLNDFT